MIVLDKLRTGEPWPSCEAWHALNVEQFDVIVTVAADLYKLRRTDVC